MTISTSWLVPREKFSFVSQIPLMFLRQSREKHLGQGETKLNVFRTASQEVFCYTSQLKQKENKTPKNCSLDAQWHTNLKQFQGAQPDHV